MTPTIISELTASSFRITWDNDEMENEADRTLYLYEGDTYNHIYRLDDITLSGSHLFTGLKSDVQYKVVIQRGFTGSSIASVETHFVTTLQLEQTEPVNPIITANQQPKKSKNTIGYWAFGIFTAILIIIMAVVRKNREVLE